MKKLHISMAGKRAVNGYLFILPWLLGFLLFYVRSLYMTVEFSLSDLTVLSTGGYNLEFVGLKNYYEAFFSHASFKQTLTTSIGNMVIDAVISRLTNGRMTYDDGGAMAAQGKLHPELLRWMMDDPYLSKKPPKTTGRELYGPVYVDRLMEKAGTLNVAPTDLLHTVTRFTAETIAYGLRRFSPQLPQRLIVGGGGSLNRCLMEQLRQVLTECRVMTNEDLGLNSSAKEAVAFAPSATGARHPVVMGKISL